ncbi:MAG: hypothetical protein HY067_01660 [Betaproteobacteria bacterium]|nr:hypothetical protein [Betaproteobacteria bacterium]
MSNPYLAAAVAALVILFAPRPAAAHDDDVSSGKSNEVIGKVHFPVSCNEAAQREFDRAVALYHSFWFDPANESYKKVLELDPTCGMADWGLALSALGNPFAWPAPAKAMQAGSGYIEKAQQVGARSEREKGFIDALAALFANWQDAEHRPRALAWEQSTAKVAAANPDEIETQIFYALALIANAQPTDKTFANQLKAGAILQPLFESRTDHPGVAHYLIHAYDYTGLVDKGLPAARRYASIAPSAPHALHMPAHIFTRLGLWEDSIETNSASAKAAKAEMHTPSLSLGSYNALHAMDYMMYAYLQRSQDKAAQRLMDEVSEIQKLDAANFPAAYALAAIPARYALERRRWEEAAQLELRPKDMPWKQFPHAEAVNVYARALGAARSGKRDVAAAHIERLKQLQAELQKMKLGYWAQQTEIQITAASAWLAFADGKNDEALAAMQKAVELETNSDKHPVTPGPLVPARELLGEMLLEMDKPHAALAEFSRETATEPNRYRAIANATRAAELSGDRQMARALADQLLQLTAKRDTERPELLQAQLLLSM